MTTAVPHPVSVSVCIATRNRPELLAKCVRSLMWLDVPSAEVLITDDASEPAVEGGLRASLPSDYPWPIRVVRNVTSSGYIVARNEMTRRAKYSIVLTLDDDAELVDRRINDGIRLLNCDPGLGAVGFAQLTETGERYDGFMQPAPVDYACFAPTFYGYAHLVRRELFLRLGGYRERFRAYGEETEFCKRLWDAGASVVYLPDVGVKHVHSPSGRQNRTRIRYGFRNAILNALYNEPFPMPLLSIPARVAAHIRWGYQVGVMRDLSLGWQLKEFILNLLPALVDRRPLRLSTYRMWDHLKAKWPAYRVGGLPLATGARKCPFSESSDQSSAASSRTASAAGSGNGTGSSRGG